MVNVRLDLPKQLKNQLDHLKKTTKKSKSFHVKEALTRYLEDMEDLRIALERLEKEGKTYTSEEVRKKLNLE